MEIQLWAKLAEAGVLVAPGWIFSTDVLTGSHAADGEGHLRISFSNSEVSPFIRCNMATADVLFDQFADMEAAIKIFGQVLREFFGET